MKHDQNIDQSLLMLSVGEISGWSKLATETHLLFCKDCQTRLSLLTRASKQIAGAFGANRATPPVDISIAVIRTKFIVYTAAMITLVGTAIGAVELRSQSKPTPNTAVMHCSPGIVSDRCR